MEAKVHSGFSAAVIAAAIIPITTLAQTDGDACALLSSEEIARILGEPVGEPRAETAEQGTACRFPTTTKSVVIRLWPTDARGFEEVRGTLDDSGAEFESASDVGDAAYFSDDRIYVRKGTQGLTVSLEGDGDANPKRRETLTEVAKAGLAKLQ